MSKNNKIIDLFKKEVEKKFFPYADNCISSKDILEIFLPYAKDKESFKQLSETELLEVYKQWHKEYGFLFKKKVSEMEKPEMEE